MDVCIIKYSTKKTIEMETQQRPTLTVETNVEAPVEIAWTCWTQPEHITKWSFASPDWHTPQATNDLREGGNFSTRMEAKDGSMGFDFGGVYDVVKQHEEIAYTMGDGRKVDIHFIPEGNRTRVIENFQAEETNSLELQQGGWQAIMDNFKRYTEAYRDKE
jgi:uncharacterized protein YndB with AHSA1/START domain